MHSGHLLENRVCQVQVKTLRLADVGSSANGQVNQLLLRNFPDSLVDLLNPVGDILDVLYTTIVCNDLVLDDRCPESNLRQVPHQVSVHADELTGEHTPRVNVRRERFEAFVVAQDLRSAGGWHGRHQ